MGKANKFLSAITTNSRQSRIGLAASPRIELGSGASETLILSIVLRGHKECNLSN